MGEFTQSLLKLTEFPFSYSLMGLLALIIGQGINLEELSFTTIGPLLILMGFVATTLSIWDPVGACQRRKIIGPKIEGDKFSYFMHQIIFDEVILLIFPLPYILAIRFSPEEMRKKYSDIKWSQILKDYYVSGYTKNILEELAKIGHRESAEIKDRDSVGFSELEDEWKFQHTDFAR